MPSAYCPRCRAEGWGASCWLSQRPLTLRLRLPSLRLFTDGSTANHRFYRRRGYRETDRCEDGSFLRVYYIKVVAPHAQVAEACR